MFFGSSALYWTWCVCFGLPIVIKNLESMSLSCRICRHISVFATGLLVNRVVFFRMILCSVSTDQASCIYLLRHDADESWQQLST